MVGCDRASNKAPAQQNGVVATRGLPPQHVGETPMAERVAVLGLLNKRNGIVRNLTMKPGDALKIRDAVIRLRACETTAPWETPPVTGAFVQLDVEQPNQRWHRVFSGWVYKETPSLNAVEHPVYDVWVKSCTMNWPAAEGTAPAEGKGAVGAPAGSPRPRSSSSRSRAAKSGADAATPPPVTEAPSVEPAPSAAPSNST